MNKLTPQRLFSDPPLQGQLPTQIAIAPDGGCITYLAPGSDDRERLDLWRYDRQEKSHQPLLDAKSGHLTSTDITQLTQAERAERERKRQFSHGITQYLWHPDGVHLLIPIDGQLYLVNVSEPQPVWRQLTPNDTRQTSVQLSPEGTWVSYIRQGDLFAYHLAQGYELQVTNDASETRQNGIADFLAAEEMHRFEGHWWSQDEQFLIYTKVDEAAVEVSHRLEIDANGSRQIAQRYPFAGADNPQVRLCRFDIRTQQHVDIWQDDPPAVYLARAGVYNNQIVIQTQDRLQQHLWVQRFDTHSHSWSTVHSETSTSWINLTDDLFALASDRWLFSSEQDGQRKLVIIGDQLRRLNGPAHINHVHGHDETYAYANGWDDTPTQNHLYKIRLDGSGFETLTRSPGWHEVAVNTKQGVFIDRWSSIHEPVNMTLNTLDGHSTDAIYGDPINDNHPYFPFRTQHAVAQFGELSAADGQTLHYRLTPPQDIRGRHPIVLYVYGGPGAQKVKNEWSPLLLQMFASHGFGVLELDNRGATNRGRHFEAPIYRQLGQVEVNDQVAGLGVLTEYDWVDTDRIGVFGHSYGGYMTLMCLCQAPHKFSCGVAVAPVSDWHLYDSHYTERYMGMPHDNVEGYARANVLNHLDKLEAPLLLMHGMADDNVLFTHSTQIMSKLQSLNKPFELMTYPGAKHAIQERAPSIHRFELILDFFGRNLGSAE